MLQTQRTSIFMTDQPAGSRRRGPTIVANPTGDRAFLAAIEQLLSAGVRRPSAVEDALRPSYPRVHIRRREISGERLEVWYVYREGHWVPRESDG